MVNYKEVVNELFIEYREESKEWWPTFSECEEDRIYEMMIGLILTRQMSWKRTKEILGEMMSKDLINPNKIVEFGLENLKEFLRKHSVNFYRQKSVQIWNLSKTLIEKYSGSTLELGLVGSVDELRKRLEELPGIGHESSEYLTLYAYDVPYLPGDKNVRRVAERISGKTFEEVRQDVENQFGNLTENYKLLHALLFEHGRKVCRKIPRCEECKITNLCKSYRK